ncbi:hypothetical protein CcaverHIS631_0102500 [Cutaneotrichosporon cavernicola]|nr:hypothetical protein CcaverHIS631_0102500 [Cutaneotrichosporon cavernicola]
MSLVRPTPPPPALARTHSTDSWESGLAPLPPIPSFPRLSLGFSRSPTPTSSGIPSMPGTPFSSNHSSSAPLSPRSPLSAHFTEPRSSPYPPPLTSTWAHQKTDTSLLHSDVWGKAVAVESETWVKPRVRRPSASLKAEILSSLPFNSKSPPPVRGRVISSPRPLRAGPTLSSFDNQARQILPPTLSRFSTDTEGRSRRSEKPPERMEDDDEAGCWTGFLQCLHGDRYD